MLADVISILKRIATEAVDAARPADIFYGTVRQLSPLTVSISQKQELSGSFLRMTQTAAERIWHVGERVILLQKPGGQEFVILDKEAQR